MEDEIKKEENQEPDNSPRENNQDFQKKSDQYNSPTNFLDKIPKHNWAVATYVFAIISILLAISVLTGTGVTGKVISQSQIETQINDFVNQELLQGTTNAEITSISKQSGLYVAMVNFEGDIIPLYFTQDGNFISQGQELMPINSDTTNTQATNQNNQAQEVPKSDNPEVELFIWSYCPYGVQAQGPLADVANILG
jgi:hypothetical protein